VLTSLAKRVVYGSGVATDVAFEEETQGSEAGAALPLRLQDV
jgi:hypothetical protein